MSWLARSFANTLHLENGEEEEEDKSAEVEKNPRNDAVPRLKSNDAVFREDRPRDSTHSSGDCRSSDGDGDCSYNYGGDEKVSGDYDEGRGMREDLTEFRDSVTRQFWGVASFLAPPPPPPPPPLPPLSQRSAIFHMEKKSDVVSCNDGEEEVEEFVEYDEGESGQSGEIANFSPLDDHCTNIVEDAVGITEEVLAFARNIAHHPETWLDFPLSEEEEFDDFDISDAQYKHVMAIEHLATRLSALRFELCPVHMSEGYFWMVYFVLLHSRLNKNDADLLSSPQLVQARAMWMQELQKQAKVESYWSGMSAFHSKESIDSPHGNFIMQTYQDTHFGHQSNWIPPSESSMHQLAAEQDIEKHSLDEIEFIDKTVIKEDPQPKLQDKEIVVGSSSKMPMQDDIGDDDDWLKDDSDLIGYSGTSFVGNEDDISFSDLEDDIDSSMPVKYKTPSTERNIATKTA